MAGVYSHTFHRHTGTGPWTWTCPTGKRAVVKMMSGVNPAATAQQVVCKVSGTNVWVASLPANSAAFGVGLHLVIDEGEVLEMSTTNSAMSAYAGGFLFDHI